jgi:transcriptional regulator with XRE-family HTH domain
MTIVPSHSGARKADAAVRDSLASRVTTLIGRVNGGSVNAAAKAIGIPQPTLNRIASGKTVSPRLDVVQQLASYYKVSVDWLLNGGGHQQPIDELARALVSIEWLAWRRCVDSLGLEPAVRDVVLKIPTATLVAWNHIAAQSHPKADSAAYTAARGALGEVHRREVQAWTALLENLVGVFGRKMVAKDLAAGVDQARLGFNATATMMLMAKEITGVTPSNVGAWFGTATDGLLTSWSLAPAPVAQSPTQRALKGRVQSSAGVR